jgi:hypothetical protein
VRLEAVAFPFLSPGLLVRPEVAAFRPVLEVRQVFPEAEAVAAAVLLQGQSLLQLR